MADSSNPNARDKTVLVAGCGNIGSQLIPHLGRTNDVARVTPVDHDVYEAKNLHSQDITREDVKKSKATIQGRRLRRINPDLEVTAIVDAVQNVPLGLLRASDVILGCLDSREARRWLNEASWRMGTPLIDAGVEPGGLLARVEVYVPSPDAPCLECRWDEQDYDLLEQGYACGDRNGEPAPTNAPACLGALAASLQAIECHKLLAGHHDALEAGRQVLIDASHHKHYVTRMTRNPRCRFDHEIWSIARWRYRPEDLTIGRALKLAGAAAGNGGSCSLGVEGQAFVRAMACAECGHVKRTFRLRNRLRPADRTCKKCGGKLIPVGFEMLDALDARHLPKRLLSRSLASVGFRPGDVCSVTSPDGRNHYELGA